MTHEPQPRKMSFLKTIFSALLFLVFLYPCASQAAIFGPGSNLLGWFTFDEGSGTSPADSSGNNYTGTLFNSPAWITGNVGAGAISFDGVNDYFEFGAVYPSSLFDLSQTYFTASVWVKLPSLGSDRYILNKYGNNTKGWVLGVDANDAIYFSGSGVANSTGRTASSTIPDTNWHHIALVRDDTVYHVYLDGVEKTLVTVPTAYPQRGNAILMAGGRSTTGAPPSIFYQYSIDDIRIYNRALNSTEIVNVSTYGTNNDTFPPEILSVTASSSSSSVANITWTTDEPSDSQIDFGTTLGYGSQTTLDTGLVTSHSQSLTSLSANTTYNFRVRSRDAIGNLATSSNYSFTTASSSNSLTIVKAGSGVGTVSGGSISCGATCSQVAFTGTQIVLTAVPNLNNAFSGWSGGGCSGTGTCTITLNSDTVVTATFAPGSAVYYGNSVTRNVFGTDFTWTFNCGGNQCTYGRFVNGEYWVVPVDQFGTTHAAVTITSITPLGEENGAQVNPTINLTGTKKQGILTGFTSYDSSLNIMMQLPYQALPGSSIGKVLTKDVCFGSIGTAPRCVSKGDILTVLSSIPANNGATVFRPPWQGTWKPLYTTDKVLFERLPRLPAISSGTDFVGGETGYQGYTVPQYELSHTSGFSGEFYRATSPDDAGIGGNYAADQAESYMAKVFAVFGTEPNDKKAQAVYTLIQKGIDNYAVFKMGVPFSSGAGQHIGKKPPIAFFAALYDDPTILEDIRSIAKDPQYELNSFFQEDSQIAAGHNGNAIWVGTAPGATSENEYWSLAYPSVDNNGSNGDPYLYIDGPPGGPDGQGDPSARNYLSVAGGPLVAYAFAQHLMPWFKYAAGDPDILNWSDRIYKGYGYPGFDGGVWTLPDPCAAKAGVYGVDYGPDPNNPGDCIKHNGDPATQGRLAAYHGVNIGFSRSSFNVSLWDTLRACADPTQPTYRTGACSGLGSEPVVYDDTDNDGVSGLIDLCANTPAAATSSVNQKGCPKPIMDSFDIATDISYSNLFSVSNFKLGKKGLAKIDWPGSVNIASTTGRLNFNSGVTIEHNKVSINSSALSGLNAPATITMYGVTESYPVILKDGVRCTDCQIISNTTSNSSKTIVFSVQGFSEYEIVQDSVNQVLTGATAVYNFEQPSGTTTLDWSGNDRTGTLLNGPNFSTGKVGQYSLYLDGLNKYVSVTNSTNLFSGGTTSSFATWIKTSTTTKVAVIGKTAANSGDRRFNFFLNSTYVSAFTNDPGRFAFEVGNGNTSRMSGRTSATTTIGDNQWHHIAVNINFTLKKVDIFFDGTPMAITYATNNLTSTSSGAISSMCIGITCGFGAPANAYAGYMDDFRFYNRELTQTDVNDLIALGNSSPGADTTAPSISSIASSTASTTASITWTTNESATSTVEYGLTGSYGSVANDNSLVTFHSINLSGLTPNTLYHFRVSSSDASGNKSTSADSTFVTAPSAIIPTVTTQSASSIGEGTSVLNGNITATGGATPTTRGFAYGTSATLATTIATTSSSGSYSTGAFTDSISGLSCATTYYFRPYATNSVGTGYGTIVSFSTSACPDITPPVISSVASSTSQTTANITWNTNESADSAIEYGLTTAYGSVANNLSLTTSHSLNISSLTPNTLYHFRVSSSDSSGNTTVSSDYKLVTTIAHVFSVSTGAVSSVGETTVTLNGSITDTAGSNATESGFAYGIDPSLNTVIATSTLGAQSGAVSFTQNLTSLSSATTYYARAYATNASTTAYGSIVSFTTSTPVPSNTAPTVTTGGSSSVTQTTVTLNGSITDTGGATVITRGFEYGLTTAYGSNTTDTGSYDVGSYSGAVSSLECNTLYHFRSYATNSVGTSYGSDATFATGVCDLITESPTLATQAVTSLGQTTAILNGSVTDTGGATVTTRGFEYGLTTSYSSQSADSGSYGATSFSLSISGLVCNTPYHYRAYGINSAGTSYGSDATFTTSACDVVSSGGGGGGGGGGGSSSGSNSNSIAPSISSISVKPTNTTSLISWGTDKLSTTQVEYGLTASFGNVTVLNSSLSLTHAQTLSNLAPNTRYFYRVISKDSLGNAAISGVMVFTTAINTSGSSSNTPVLTSFPRNLTLTNTGTDVLSLQKTLNDKGYTISTTGPGSKGNETIYFGPATKAALIKFQSANGIPATGFFGPLTRAFITGSSIPTAAQPTTPAPVVTPAKPPVIPIPTTKPATPTTTKPVTTVTPTPTPKPIISTTTPAITTPTTIQTVIGPFPASAIPPSGRYTSTLSLGSKGTEVTALQTFLANYPEPSIYPEKKITGVFDQATEAAVMRFQSFLKIKQEGELGFGIVGETTRAVVNRLLGR